MDEKTRKKSLIYSILDGSFYSMMIGFGQSFFVAFATFLQASSFQLGLLDSLPRAVGSFSQLLTDKLLSISKTRKRLVLFWAFIQTLVYVPIALVYFLGEFRIWVLIALASAFWVFDMLPGPAWNSWMGDLVPENERGRYFGRRNKIGGIISYASLLAAGAILQHYRTGNEWLGFLIIFCIAIVVRFFSFFFLYRQAEPPYNHEATKRLGFIAFIRKARENNSGRFILFLGVMNFAVYLASPFFAAHMLYSLGFGWWTFTLVTGASLIVKYLSMPLWGRAADRYGTRRLLVISAFLMPAVPLLWMLGKDVWFLLIVQAFSGFTWAGFELCSFSFLFDTTKPENRVAFVMYSNVVNGAAYLIGGLVGGLIATYNHLFWSPYLLVFLVSGILRYLATFIFVPMLKEVRQVEHISAGDLLFDMAASTATMGIVSNVVVITKQTVVRTAEPIIDVMKDGMESVAGAATEAADATVKTTRKVVRRTHKAFVDAVEKTGKDIEGAIAETETLVTEAVEPIMTAIRPKRPTRKKKIRYRK